MQRGPGDNCANEKASFRSPGKLLESRSCLRNAGNNFLSGPAPGESKPQRREPLSDTDDDKRTWQQVRCEVRRELGQAAASCLGRRRLILERDD